jgi:hypothetical protein
MSIDEQATTDLSLNDEDAENVIGGKKTKKTAAKKHVAAPTRQVPYLKVDGSGGPVDDSGHSGDDDCAEDSGI